MKKKITLPLYLLSVVGAAIIFGAGGFFLAKDGPKTFMDFADNNSAITTNDTELDQVYQLYNTINQNYYKKVDQDKLIQGAMKGMTEALGDPYSTFLDKAGASALSESLSDSFEGIGATLSLVDKEPVIAQTPIKGTPAQKAGLKAEDVITKVAGKATKGQELSEVVSQIRGEKGTKVDLTIKRGNDTFEVAVTRDRIPIETVHGELDAKEKTVGYVQITTFGEGTTKELQRTIENLREEGAQSFVFDVRQNPGGLLERVEEIASMFLKNGDTIVKFEDNQGNKSETVASKELDGGFKISEPAVVLVDGNSASAAEIFAAALNEAADIPIVGTQTFGKGTMQQVAELNTESELKLTVAKWLTPSGKWINEKGLTPTIKADYPSYAYLPPLSRSEEYRLGDSGTEVDYLNQFLKALGYKTKGDQFNEITEKAVKDFQKKHKLKETGKVTGETADAIESELAKALQGQDFAYQAALKEITANKKK